MSSPFRLVALILPALTVLSGSAVGAPGSNASNTNLPSWITRPLSLADAVNTALQHNGEILRGKADLEAAYGVVVQTRAIALPKAEVGGGYKYDQAVESFPTITALAGIPGAPTSLTLFEPPKNQWQGSVRVLQSVYEGGRINASLRAARLTREQALLQYQTVIADALLSVRVSYYGILAAEQQIIVHQASLELLQKELEDTTRRFNAGTVPRFNVLRAEVEVANERPRLIHAQNSHRIAKNNLVNLLGSRLPRSTSEDVPMQLAGKLEEEPFEIELPAAVGQALERRTELAALAKAEKLSQENIINAQAGFKPGVQVFSGYGARNSSFSTDPARDVYGWNAGLQVNWNIFDGLLTQGRVQEARAYHERSQVDLENAARRVELEVRTAFSYFTEAKEVLASQKKVQEEAEEALRLATSRYQAGSGTQLDVLNAQTSLTQARSTQVQALHDYEVARARLERAIGQRIEPETKGK